MEAAFQWNNSYSVRVHAMDAQHRELFEIVHELSAAMRAGHGKDVTGRVLSRLIDCTFNHFAAEEKLMKENKFPGLAAHCIEHRALEEKITAFKKNFDAGSNVITPDLMRFLQNWLTTHILTIDRNYSDFLNSRGVF
jgi:hemerythrin-like metal-binding protein